MKRNALVMGITTAMFALCATAEDITTLKGKTYTGVTVQRVEPDGIIIKYPAGVSKAVLCRITPRYTREVRIRSRKTPAVLQWQQNR